MGGVGGGGGGEFSKHTTQNGEIRRFNLGSHF